MVQIYIPSNDNFTNNGDVVLTPIECLVNAEINGVWALELTHPIDEEGRWKLIEVGAVIKAPSFNGEQLFRIRQTEKQDSGIIATAEPIFLDAVGDCFLLDVRPTNKTGQQALDDILSPNPKYSGSSDITTRATAYFVRRNALDAIAGSEDASFLTRWGGEILYNNYEIIINERVGGDYGLQLLYGKNIPVDGMKEAVNMDGVVTRIIPKAFNGHLLPGNSPWVDSPIINSYPTVMTSVVEYDYIKLASDVEGDVEEGTIVCPTMQDLYTELRKAANAEFTEGIDKPTVSITADMVLLQNTVDYREYQSLEEVSLGDTIHCKHDRLGIVSDARVLALSYNSIRQRVESVTIGAIAQSFMDRVASTINRTEKAITKSGGVKAEQIEGFINGALAQLRIQNTVAKKQEVMAILFEDLDPASPTFGALGIGTQGWQIAQARTADDRDWAWGTAATSKGIIADYIVAGLLSDKNGLNFWDLDTGEFSLSSTATVGGSTVQQIANNAASAAVDAQTQQQIFNKLTNNGASQGIYLSNGQLYVNGTYIQAGAINAGLITTGTLSAIDISGVNISGSAITGGTVTGTAINNGNGTFQVDASGNLKATSAEITGAIKSGSTISGATISGGTVTGTSINNGSGKFQVDASGNLKATSAEITGAIKSGSTITGSAISGGTVTGTTVSGGTVTGTTITGSRIESSATSGSTTSTIVTENGRTDFTRRVSGTPASNVNVGIGAGGLQVTYPNRSPLTDIQITTGITIREGSLTSADGIKGTWGASGISIRQNANNYITITASNITITKNGSVVWKAIN